MYVLGSLKSFFQLVHKVDTSLYLIEPTLQLCYKLTFTVFQFSTVEKAPVVDSSYNVRTNVSVERGII